MVECCEWWIWWCVHAQTHTSNAEPVMYENQISFIQLFENTQMLYINGARHGLICTCRDTEKVYWHKLKCNLKFCIFISKHPNYYSGRKACYAVRTHTQRLNTYNPPSTSRQNSKWCIHTAIENCEHPPFANALHTECKCVVRSSARNGSKNDQNFFACNSLQGFHISDGQWSLWWCDERPVLPSQKKKEKRSRYTATLIFLAMEAHVCSSPAIRSMWESIKCPFGSFHPHRNTLNGAIHFSIRLRTKASTVQRVKASNWAERDGEERNNVPFKRYAACGWTQTHINRLFNELQNQTFDYAISLFFLSFGRTSILITHAECIYPKPFIESLITGKKGCGRLDATMSVLISFWTNLCIFLPIFPTLKSTFTSSWFHQIFMKSSSK